MKSSTKQYLKSVAWFGVIGLLFLNACKEDEPEFPITNAPFS